MKVVSSNKHYRKYLYDDKGDIYCEKLNKFLREDINHNSFKNDFDKEVENCISSENWLIRVGAARFGTDFMRKKLVNDNSWLVRFLCCLYGDDDVRLLFVDDTDWRVQSLLERLK